MIDTHTLLANVDLPALIARDLGMAPLKVSGGWSFWRCPFHDDHGPSFAVKKDGWFCFGACREGGDAIAYLRKRDPGLSFRDACQRLGLSEIGNLPPAPLPPPPPPYASPGPEWQANAEQVVSNGVLNLFGDMGQGALKWLHDRGLTDATLQHWRIGYNPRSQNMAGFYVPRGILIPCYMAGPLWGVHIRLPKNDKGKYAQLKGSITALFGADRARGRRVIVLCEGEFDAMLLDQECRDLVGAVSTTGGAGRRWERAWSQMLIYGDKLLIAYDSDAAGANGSSAMTGLSKRTRPIKVPHGKDITEYHVQGGNLYGWMALERSRALAEMVSSDPMSLLRARTAELRKRIADAEGDTRDALRNLYTDLCVDFYEIAER